MQTARQRPSLTINAKKASQASVTAGATNSPSNTHSQTSSRNPYQTPQASTSNFAVYQATGYQTPQQNPVTPITPNYYSNARPPLVSSSSSIAIHARNNDSKISIFSDEDDTYYEDTDDLDYDKMSSSLYSDSSLYSSSIVDPSEYKSRSGKAEESKRTIVFSKPFETLLSNTYQNYITNPQITPFSGRYPPSGIVSKVSKEALKVALQKNIPIDISSKSNTRYKGTSLSAQSNLLCQIRQKLIEMCSSFYQNNNNSAQGSVGFGRNTSVSSLNSFNNNTSIDEGLKNLTINTANNGNPKFPQPNSNDFLYFNALLTSPQLSPINHTFSPINSTFNNCFIPDMSNPGAVGSQNVAPNSSASIHEALNHYINHQSQHNHNNLSRLTSSNGSNQPPLTPITPIAAYSNNPFANVPTHNDQRVLSPTFDTFGYAQSAHSQQASGNPKNSTLSSLNKPFSLSSPFKETFDHRASPRKSKSKFSKSKTNLSLSSTGAGDYSIPKSSSTKSIGSSSNSSVKTLDNASSVNGDDINVSSKRKRDSLKLKRFGGNK